MTINHIDQLAEWWSEAERGPFRKGDMLIARREDECVTYEVYPAGCDHNDPAENVRILSRAPKPKPAWHDAVAVIAHIGGNELPRVLVRDNDGAFVDGVTGHAYAADRLRDVTPLIEAKVTDEMVEKARDYMSVNTGQTHTHNAIRGTLAAALGLETE